MMASNCSDLQNCLQDETTPLLHSNGDQGQASIQVSSVHNLQTEEINQQTESEENLTSPAFSCRCCSGRLTRALLFAVGLWNPTQGKRLIISVLFIIIGSFVQLALAATSYVGSNGLMHSNFPFSETITRREPIMGEEMEVAFALDVSIAASQMAGHILLLFCVCFQSRRPYSLTLCNAYESVSSRDWGVINVQIAVYFLLANLLSTLADPSLVPLTLTILATIALNVMASFGTGCWLFAMMAVALETYAENCFTRISQLQSGTIDDVIDIHERLCKHVFETVSGLKFWFIVHWFSYWIACMIYILNIELRINMQKDDKTYFDMFRYVILLLIVLYSFICPCFYASRVTSACRNIISRLNKTRTCDWSPDHPFYCRATLDSFIFYAERRECGFKIGQITFNSRLVWVSFFLSFCGFVVKFAN